MKSKQVKRVHSRRVQVYFSSDAVEVLEEVRQISKATGLSLSDVVYVGFITGFPLIKDGMMKNIPYQKSPKKK